MKNSKEYVQDVENFKREKVHETLQRLIQYRWNSLQVVEHLYQHLHNIADDVDATLLSFHEFCQHILKSNSQDMAQQERRIVTRSQKICAQNVDRLLKKIETSIADILSSTTISHFSHEVFSHLFKVLIEMLRNLKIDFLKTPFVIQLYQSAPRSFLIHLSQDIREEFMAFLRILEVYRANYAKTHSSKYHRMEEEQRKVSVELSQEAESNTNSHYEPLRTKKGDYISYLDTISDSDMKKDSHLASYNYGSLTLDYEQSEQILSIMNFDDQMQSIEINNQPEKEYHRKLISRIRHCNQKKDEKIIKYLSQERPQHQFVQSENIEKVDDLKIFVNKQTLIVLPKIKPKGQSIDRSTQDRKSIERRSNQSGSTSQKPLQNQFSIIFDRKQVDKIPYQQYLQKVNPKLSSPYRKEQSISLQYIKSLKLVNNLTELHPNNKMQIGIHF